MKVRYIFWYRNDEDALKDKTSLSIPDLPHILAMSSSNDPTWHQYNPNTPSRHIHTRDKFEKCYLEWKAQNEG